MKSQAPSAGPGRVIAIGASAGGVEALQHLVKHLPSRLNAAVCVVLHTGPETPSLLGRILARHSVIRVTVAEDGMKLRAGTVYVAQPDYHLMVADGHLRLVRGPRENRHRPAIDTLFRSVAENYGKRAVGVVLTGFLDDGTAGLQEIKREGGIAIVQDPDEAVAPEMPRSAIDQVKVDHIAKLEDIPRLLVELSEGYVEGGKVKTSKNGHKGAKTVCKDEQSVHQKFTCPDCGGPMEEQRTGEIQRFRCRVGHKYSLDSLMAANEDAVERALWAAMQTLEQSATLNRRLADRSRHSRRKEIVKRYEERAVEKEHHAQMLRRVLTSEEHTHAEAS